MLKRKTSLREDDCTTVRLPLSDFVPPIPNCGHSRSGIPQPRFPNGRKEDNCALPCLEFRLHQLKIMSFGASWMGQLNQDLRFAVRALAKNPRFTIVALLSLALGIGANAGVFSLVDAVLIRQLPYPHPENLVRISGYYPQGAVVAFQDRSRTMEVAAHTTGEEVNLAGQGEAIRILGSSVSANLFAVLGARAELGRVFQAGEDKPGRDSVVILSDSLWRQKFASDPQIVGRMIAIEGVNRQVVGVMPPAFEFPSAQIKIWIPLHLDPSDEVNYWDAGYMPMIGRLRPGVTMGQARTELRELIRYTIQSQFPWPMAETWNSDATVLPLQSDMVGDVRTKVLVLFSAVGMVLLIACANVATLLLCLAATRRKEIALRSALGANRSRIIRQLLTESVVLALAGGGLGVALALEGLEFLKSFLPADMPRVAEAGIDARVLVFVTAISILTGLAFGLAPALSISKVNLTEALKAGERRSSHSIAANLRSGLIAGEVALAVVLAVGAGLLIKSLWKLTRVDPGFLSANTLSVRISPDESSCRQRSQCIAFYDELLRRAQSIEGVSEVAAVNAAPLSDQLPFVIVELEGHPLKPNVDLAPTLWAGAVTPDYFHLLGIRVIAGRSFTDGDAEHSAPVVMVSASTASRYWPGESAIGKHLRVVWEKQWRTVVGVASDVRQFNLANNAPQWFAGALYMPYPQAVGINRQQPSGMTLLLRTSQNAAQTGEAITSLVAGMNPNVPVGKIQTLAQVESASTNSSRSMVWLFLCFAGTAIVLAAIGTYGVISYTTSQRSYELGVRIAMGATPTLIFGLVVKESVRLVVLGLAVGIAAALALTHLLTSFLYGVTATDPLTFLAVSLLLIVIGALAGLIPARRAASIDPLMALRAE
jgi:putative ABC transport system permease protein